MSIQQIADCMKGGLGFDAPSPDIAAFLSSCQAAARDLEVEFWLDSGLNDLQAAGVIRAIVMERIGDVSIASQVALSRGYLLPDSPFPKIDRANATRSLFQPIAMSSESSLFTAAVELSKIAKKYKDGQIKFDRSPAGQLSSYEVSVDGIAPQSGDPLVDILGYQPDGDFVKRKRAIDSLAKLDFSKRKPYLLFTMETDEGVAICWGRMRDASGYTISRRDVFYNVDLPDIVEDNSSLEQSTRDLLKNERFFQALSFYDWTTPQDVLAVLDDSTSPDTLYSYRVAGVQRKAPATPFIFDVPMNAMLFSPALAESIVEILAEESERTGRDPNAVSPYPAIAQAVYGDPSLGWIIAGCNVLASIRRGDPVDSVRANSYIGSTAERLLAEVQAGRVFVPSDLSKVQETVESSISSYGVSQTILSVLDGTGVTNFVSGKDDPNGIQATQQSVEGSTAGLARILSVIDPETATLDPNLLVVTGQKKSSRGHAIAVKTQANAPALDELVGAGLIDLTVPAGIARFMQLLRAVYDFYPGAFV